MLFISNRLNRQRRRSASEPSISAGNWKVNNFFVPGSGRAPAQPPRARPNGSHARTPTEPQLPEPKQFSNRRATAAKSRDRNSRSRLGLTVGFAKQRCVHVRSGHKTPFSGEREINLAAIVAFQCRNSINSNLKPFTFELLIYFSFMQFTLSACFTSSFLFHFFPLPLLYGVSQKGKRGAYAVTISIQSVQSIECKYWFGLRMTAPRMRRRRSAHAHHTTLYA